MPNNATLDPENRALYGEILRAPAGYELDAAIATTYTLDFETALVIPATLAFHAAENRDQTLDTPLALLEGLERLSSKIAIFCEGGRIAGMPRGANRLTALLEDTITEVAAPGGGAFHPKLWLLRFTSLSGHEAPRLRLALLSRNLTKDMSWDLSLSLDGRIGQQIDPENAPVSGLLRALPGMATGRKTPKNTRTMVASLAADLDRAVWEPPEHIRRIRFAVNGLPGKPWLPKIGAKVGIISPFVSDRALTELTAGVARENAHLLGRTEELALLSHETLERFGHLQVLDELAETEDGEDAAEPPRSVVPARGLHAKAFLTERYASTEITLGSGNATDAALLDGSNIEVFATLSGYTRDIGSVEEQLAPEHLGRFLREFTAYDSDDTSAELEADRRIDTLVRQIVRAAPRLRCRVEEDDIVALFLSVATPVTVPEDLELHIWPLVPGETWGVKVADLSERETLLARVALRDVTRWIGLRLRDGKTGLQRDVTLGTELLNLPDNRTAEILRAIIENREAFLRYIRLLLGDVTDAAKALFAAGAGSGLTGIFGAEQDSAILEDMVRAFSGEGRQLRDIERLIKRLGDAEGKDGPVVPPEFRTLWETFRAVMPKTKGAGK
ncbi:phospholipase D family protein [Paenirhodobacter sp. CAU 1674]|uniref:phospholipase D family protein n=1 Tax=Paenirhodobacter sp. CAU 1674 TaxID=3032596 RepID=UPI0023DA6CDD|nr:phospholipase D family protein [Paenirhodobacter sp. CAU 1674]MDF2142651.1 phospholipase D family protein [Paenirhodobacter sp. CAU 1674]